MGAALTIFVLLSFSIFVLRVASVAFRLTGLTESSARFQALSAFTGTGFTTSEAETIVNYPVRRRIASLLMIIGNMGLVTVFATVVVSLVRTEGEMGAVTVQVAWLIAGLVLLWLFMLSTRADRFLCEVISKILLSTTLLGHRRFHRLLQIGDGYSVCEHPVCAVWLLDITALTPSKLEQLGLQVLAIECSKGTLIADHFTSTVQLEIGDALVLFGRDDGHDALEIAAEDQQT